VPYGCVTLALLQCLHSVGLNGFASKPLQSSPAADAPLALDARGLGAANAPCPIGRGAAGRGVTAALPVPGRGVTAAPPAPGRGVTATLPVPGRGAVDVDAAAAAGVDGTLRATAAPPALAVDADGVITPRPAPAPAPAATLAPNLGPVAAGVVGAVRTPDGAAEVEAAATGRGDGTARAVTAPPTGAAVVPKGRGEGTAAVLGSAGVLGTAGTARAGTALDSGDGAGVVPADLVPVIALTADATAPPVPTAAVAPGDPSLVSMPSDGLRAGTAGGVATALPAGDDDGDGTGVGTARAPRATLLDGVAGDDCDSGDDAPLTGEPNLRSPPAVATVGGTRPAEVPGTVRLALVAEAAASAAATPPVVRRSEARAFAEVVAGASAMSRAPGWVHDVTPVALFQ
jgi:hypothetical protein